MRNVDEVSELAGSQLWWRQETLAGLSELLLQLAKLPSCLSLKVWQDMESCCKQCLCCSGNCFLVSRRYVSTWPGCI